MMWKNRSCEKVKYWQTCWYKNNGRKKSEKGLVLIIA
jgi:hypothetical protein